MGCADVCLDHDYDGETSFSSESTRKARKPHICSECAENIRVGQSHEYRVGKSEGAFWSARTCLPCAEIRDAFVCGSWVIGMLWESMRDEMFPVWRKSGAWDCLAKLTTPEAVAKCNAEYAEWVGDIDDA